MEILSHRGYWKQPAEKNSTAAFIRSFDLGYGTETDLRDFDGQLVISHDMPGSSALAVDDLFTLYNSSKCSCRPTLALNVKADGLQKLAKEKLNQYNIKNYFFLICLYPILSLTKMRD
ncbi:MAG: hypothetical protein ACR5LG_07810 [Sodalis sp. (in: enterobacteria)]|uniref:hypothetical protein n=1 Tax=Sodalis sp. (in: enterobacteria) TaxID=1898979 RepID=UPI003F3560B8